MRDILLELNGWHASHKPVALATVVQTWGSSPRKAGAKMAVTLGGEIAGSVSGGCVENAVVEAAVESLKTGKPRLLHFGVADETAWEVGLACGGSIDIFVKPVDPAFFESLRSVLRDGVEAIAITVVRGPQELLGRELLVGGHGAMSGGLGEGRDDKAVDLAKQALSLGISRRGMLDESVEVFLEAILPPPTLIILGGVHIAVALVSLAKTLGYHTIVIDPRKAWGNEGRFPQADQLIQAWPAEAFRQVRLTRWTAVTTLTHDPRLDDAALKIALPSMAFYVGALGSRATQAKRRERLREAGLTEAHLARLHAPVGLDIGAESPEEVALAIMAEVVEAHRKQKQPSAESEAGLPPIR